MRVVLGDGALGNTDGAPYDLIIATVGAWGLPSAWLEQLAPDGRLVVPLRLRGSVSRSIVFERVNGRWPSTRSEMCTFMPLRGIADDARRIISLTLDRAVTLQTHREQTVGAAVLTGVLDQPCPISPGPCAGSSSTCTCAPARWARRWPGTCWNRSSTSPGC